MKKSRVRGWRGRVQDLDSGKSDQNRKQAMKLHPYADIFPAMSAEEFSELKADIAKHGQRETIKTKDGKIIDGKNRFNACNELGKRPRFEEYTGEDILEYVVSLNLSRRHLSTSQRAAIAASLLPEYEKAAKERQSLSGRKLSINLQHAEKGRSTEKAADAFGVSASTVIKADKIKDESPKVFKQVRDGKISVNEAQKVSFAERMSRLQKPSGGKKVMTARDCYKVQYGMVDMNGNFIRGTTSKYLAPKEDSQEGIDREWLDGKFDNTIDEISERYLVRGK